MNQSTAKDLLAKLFEPRNAPLKGVRFASNYMDKANKEKYAIYTAVSEAQRASNLSHDFAYTVANLAVDILIDADDWQDSDALAQCIDQTVPVYNGELMEIYANDWHAVDEAEEEYGLSVSTDGQNLSVLRAQRGWYYAIEQMVHGIINNLPNLEAHD